MTNAQAKIDKPAFTATPYVYKDPRTIPLRDAPVSDEPWIDEIDPKIMEWVKQAIAAKEVIESQPNTDGSEPTAANDDQTGANANTPASPAFVFTPYVPIDDPAKLPRREFAFGTHYIRKYVSVTCAPGGLGKTSNSIVEALSMVSGKPLLNPDGGWLPGRLRVQLFNGEDPRDEMILRIEAARRHYKLTPEDLDGLFLDIGREQDMVVMREDKRSGLRVCEPIVEAVVEQIVTNKIDVMIVDPFVSTHQVNENDNGAIDKVAKLWGQVADQTNCAIDIVHHLRKLNDRDPTIDDARGAVSLIGAARSVRILGGMSPDQAKEAGLQERDRFEYFYISMGKSNLTKRSSRMEWRHLESFPLGNGGGLQIPQDHVGVVTPWIWPSKEAAAEQAADEVSAEQLAMILVRLKNQTSLFARNANSWAGFHVMDAVGINRESKAGRDHAARIIGGLIADGTLVVKQEMDHRRHPKSVVRPAVE